MGSGGVITFFVTYLLVGFDKISDKTGGEGEGGCKKSGDSNENVPDSPPTLTHTHENKLLEPYSKIFCFVSVNIHRIDIQLRCSCNFRRQNLMISSESVDCFM